MADLAKLRKDIVADGKFQKSDVELIRQRCSMMRE